MSQFCDKPCTAFEGGRELASGPFVEVAAQAKVAFDRGDDEAVLIFDNANGRLIDVDYRGAVADVRRRISEAANRAGDASESLSQTAARGPGRPRLGVVAREVTLLPRHWEWLNSQPGGASVTIRKLVEVARRANEGQDAVRISQENAYRFMSSLAGDFAGFEEASRALFAGDAKHFKRQTAAWPKDVRRFVNKLAVGAFAASTADCK
jgi:uncharacterized protein